MQTKTVYTINLCQISVDRLQVSDTLFGKKDKKQTRKNLQNVIVL